MPTLGSFMYRNYNGLVGNKNYTAASAKLLTLFIPEMRTMATEVTIPLLAPILNDPEAMVIFSGSVGMFSLYHLQRALEVEFDSNISAEKKQRLIAAHTDAVSDIHYHLFSAISLDEKKYNKSSLSFFETFNFLARYLMPLVIASTGISPALAISALIFTNKKLNQHIINESIKRSKTNEKLTPLNFFKKQFMNRNYSSTKSSYPEPTWFEIELASRILNENPKARADLKVGRWFDGEKIITPINSTKIGQNISLSTEETNPQIISDVSELINQINSTNEDFKKGTEDFSEWFARNINADPPTEFSSTFVHIQREFGRDILLDALTIEIEDVREQAKIARATADVALKSQYQNLRNQRKFSK